MRQRHLRTETLRKGVIILVKKSREFGYARVSTKHQNTDRQLQALQCYGISVKGIFIDKQSGKDFERQNYCPGDYLYRSWSLKWDVESGMWGIFRVVKQGIGCRCKNVCRRTFAHFCKR